MRNVRLRFDYPVRSQVWISKNLLLTSSRAQDAHFVSASSVPESWAAIRVGDRTASRSFLSALSDRQACGEIAYNRPRQIDPCKLPVEALIVHADRSIAVGIGALAEADGQQHRLHDVEPSDQA